MENIYSKPPKDEFKLDSLKTLDRTSLEVLGHSAVSDGATTFDMKYNPSTPIIPHPDLLMHLDRLKPILAREYGYLDFITVVKEERFKASKAQEKYIQTATDLILGKIEITGISIDGKSRTTVKIKGKYNGLAINTTNLSFENPTYGSLLFEVFNDLEREAYDYIFEGKKAVLEMFPADAETSGKDKAAGE